MPAKGTGGKHLEPKIKKKKKVYPERTGTRTGPGTVKSIAKSKKKEKLIFTDGTKKNVPGTPIVPREAKPENLGEKGFKLTFKDALNAAKKGDREKFTYKGKLYFTPTGAANNRDKMKTRIGEKGSMSGAKPTGPTKSKKKLFSKLNEKIKSFRKKTTGYSTQAEYESAKDKRIIEKRISKMKERKNQGKSYSAKNLAELEAKLK